MVEAQCIDQDKSTVLPTIAGSDHGWEIDNVVGHGGCARFERVVNCSPACARARIQSIQDVVDELGEE